MGTTGAAAKAPTTVFKVFQRTVENHGETPALKFKDAAEVGFASQPAPFAGGFFGGRCGCVGFSRFGRVGGALKWAPPASHGSYHALPAGPGCEVGTLPSLSTVPATLGNIHTPYVGESKVHSGGRG